MAKAGANPRFVVTSLKPQRWVAQTLYEELYCARGDMENRIKECQLDLYGDRTSAHTNNRGYIAEEPDCRNTAALIAPVLELHSQCPRRVTTEPALDSVR